MLPDLLNYDITNKALWQGRLDSLPMERFFQHVLCEDIRTFSLQGLDIPVLVGFCCDEGIRRNEGRVGAFGGPDKLREQLAKLACHRNTPFLDIGNIVCDDGDLEAAQQQFARLISDCHSQGLKTIAFGGGHELAWAHYLGISSYYPNLGIINFDAHFDIRPLYDGRLGTSGSPFWQIKHHRDRKNLPFEYCCLGIQPLANTSSLWHSAKEWNISYLTAEDIHTQTLAQQTVFLDHFIKNHDQIYLSICLDVFAECFAPGVSAPQPLGLVPWQTLPLLKYIVQTGKVVCIDIAELSPPLDHEQKTARLAAGIIAELLNLKD
ncbi:MAG: formimidoylglutamase [Legionellales bacterium]|nr:formimidoylglutamase [Legionellales bacterium]